MSCYSSRPRGTSNVRFGYLAIADSSRRLCSFLNLPRCRIRRDLLRFLRLQNTRALQCKADAGILLSLVFS